MKQTKKPHKVYQSKKNYHKLKNNLIAHQFLNKAILMF